MLVCSRCGKGKVISAYSRHKKGSSGAGGTWALRAPIHQRTQKPNLHLYNGDKYCTKCLRIVKVKFTPNKVSGQAMLTPKKDDQGSSISTPVI